MNETVSNPCLNCGEELNGLYCSACGQKKFDSKDRSLKFFFTQFLGAAFFLENSFTKNLWKLITSPGLQATDYAEGRQRRWMPPFSIFFLINLIYFIVNPLTDFNLPLHDHLRWHATSYSPMAIGMVEKRMEKREITYDEYEKKFDGETISLSKSLMIVNVPILTIFLALIFIRKRRHFADHFIYALYFFSFVLLSATVWVCILNLLRWLGIPMIQWLMPLGLLIIIIFYLYFSVSRFYKIKKPLYRLGIVSVLLGFLLVTIMLYRFFMFIVTFLVT
jgi:hypothetical protein